MADHPENQDGGLGARPNGADDQYIDKPNQTEQPQPAAAPKLATAYNGAGIFADLE